MSAHRNYDPIPKYFNVNFEPIIGKSCSLMNTLLDCNGQITIGDYVSFSHDCMVLTAYHDYNLFMEERQITSIVKPVVIEDGVFIGARAIICAGVTIGEHAVIGANSVVTHDIPPYSLAVGSPARVIREIPHE